jgi:hypothetical protein
VRNLLTKHERLQVRTSPQQPESAGR